MNQRKTFGIILVIIGAVMLFFSNYIAEQVAAGRAEIRSAQSQVNTIDSLFSTSKYTKPFGEAVTGSAQRKIDAGRAEADAYASLSNKLKIGGIVLIVIGGYLFLTSKKKKKTS